MDDAHERDILEFFGSRHTERALYRVFVDKILAMFPDTRVKVHKTQISFYHRHLFAAAWLPHRPMKGRPEAYLLVTFGLETRLESPRIIEAVEPYRRRWTHHVLITGPGDIDDELLGWVRQAREFSDRKREGPAGWVP